MTSNKGTLLEILDGIHAKANLAEDDFVIANILVAILEIDTKIEKFETFILAMNESRAELVTTMKSIERGIAEIKLNAK